MSLIRTIAAAAVLMMATTAADAAIVYGTGANTNPISGVNILGGSDAVMNNAPDGSAQHYRNQTSGTIGTFTATWNIAAPATIGWVVYTAGSTARSNVTGIVLTDGGGFTATSTNTQGLQATSGSTRVAHELTNFDARDDYQTIQPGFSFGNIQQIAISFSLVNAGTQNNARIQIDAIANPEPSTLALFGLGVLGLTGLVRRRRRRAPQQDAS
jgi:hypothetical protein